MEKTPKLVFHYSIDFEHTRIETTFKKIHWYKERGYTLAFPDGKTLLDIAEHDSVESLCALANTEFDPDFFKLIAQNIDAQWAWFVAHWPVAEISQTTLSFAPTYSIYLTSYGVRGSYNLPDMIVVNVRSRQINGIGSVIFHEMLHLTIESSIIKYNIPHWHKERLVDLLYKRIFPEKAFEQNLSNDVLLIDPIFTKYYGDIEEIMRHVADELKISP